MRRRARTQPRKRPTQERAQVTVGALLTATERLLVKGGMERLTTNRIAEEAGVSIGSLYQYFPTKEAIVVAVLERFAHARIRDLTEAMACIPSECTLREVIRAVISALVRGHLENPALERALLALPMIGLERVEVILENGIVLIGHALDARKDELRPKNTQLAARLLATATRGMLLYEVVKRPEWLRDSPEFVDEVTEMVARYLER